MKNECTTYVIGKATVRIHGSPDMEKFKAATERFMKRAIKRKQKKGEMGHGD